MKKFIFALVVSMLFISCESYNSGKKARNYRQAIEISNDTYRDIKFIISSEEWCFEETSNIEFSNEYLSVLKREQEAIDKFQKEKLEVIAKYYLGE